MNNDPEREQLWNDLLNDSASPEFRDALLRTTVGVARQRRRARSVLGALAMIIIPLALLLTLRGPAEPETQPRRAVARKATPLAGDTAKVAMPEIISDEELFAMFPNHALALVGPPGDQQLLILGETSAPSGFNRSDPE